MQGIVTFFREAKSELLKVEWTSRSQVVRSTAVVVGITIVGAVFLGGLDYIFGALLRKFIIGA